MLTRELFEEEHEILAQQILQLLEDDIELRIDGVFGADTVSEGGQEHHGVVKKFVKTVLNRVPCYRLEFEPDYPASRPFRSIQYFMAYQLEDKHTIVKRDGKLTLVRLGDDDAF